MDYDIIIFVMKMCVYRLISNVLLSFGIVVIRSNIYEISMECVLTKGKIDSTTGNYLVNVNWHQSEQSSS